MADHYYSKTQENPLRISRIKAVLFGKAFEFYTAGGVFSPKKVDKGTQILIENCILEDGWTVLDLGCGYGPVGITIAKEYPMMKVLMADVNVRAVMLAKKNLGLYKLDNVVTIQSDGFSKIKQKFDTILLNPPQSAGRKLCNQLISDAKENLKNHGLLQVVARHNKGGSEFEKKMKEIYGNVKAIVKKSGYRVYVSEKKK